MISDALAENVHKATKEYCKAEGYIKIPSIGDVKCVIEGLLLVHEAIERLDREEAEDEQNTDTVG